MSCPFAVDDGAYVLGALSPSERAAFEQHLGTCPACRDAVTAMAVLPGLLGRLDPRVAIASLTPDPTTAAPPTLLSGLLRAAVQERRAQRRRRARYAVAAAVAAIALAAGVGFAVDASQRPAAPSLVAEAQMVPLLAKVPVTAKIGLSEVDGGTQIAMTCTYNAGREGRWTLRLIVFSRVGGDTGQQVGTWTAYEGQTLSLTALTHLAPAEISRIELQRADHTPLLAWTP